ncbi:chondroadherin-like [Mizuhopecten yessoensis]|uniref:Chondroadherin n=1 Tax=Mizuhopecten yessoensis TaxID=6573 RepID=A0A210QGF5_MIZYE|nr:chondroadherin-like [Mizuhopecten yessoensis]OWF47825.1 Chondroadherin [Mizuhopecten yessoensis]
MARTWALVITLCMLVSCITEEIPGCVFLDINTNTFNCTSGNITSFPTREQIPYGVSAIDLSHNKLVHIPHINITAPQALKHLNLSRNHISSVSQAAFTDLTALETLDLSYNLLRGSDLIVKQYRLVMSEFHSLRVLILRGNALGMIERLTFREFGYDRLEELDLSFCAISTLQHLALENLMRLRVLDLSHNNLATFDTAAFSGVTHLHSLDLSYNKLTEITDMHLTLTSSLHFINLDNNLITAIRDNAFSGVSGLERLGLRSNRLHRITQLSLPTDMHRAPDLDNNPWSCDCHTKWIISPDSVLRTLNASIICTYPSRLRGLDIFDIDEADLACPQSLLTILTTLLITLAIIIIFGGLFMLLYHKRALLKCVRGTGVKGRYVAVYSHDREDAGVTLEMDPTFDKSNLEKEADSEVYA